MTWSEALALSPVAVSCFAMIIAQSAATSHAFALRYHESVNEDADILGLSFANATAAITGAFVVNGSPTQTAMADRAGARSQIAQLAFAGVVLVVLLFLTGPLQDLPRCVLASIVFTVAVGMIDVKGLLDIRREAPVSFILLLLPLRQLLPSVSRKAPSWRLPSPSLGMSATAIDRTPCRLRRMLAGAGCLGPLRPVGRPSQDSLSIASVRICSSQMLSASPIKCAP